jgi:hypothetical protein
MRQQGGATYNLWQIQGVISDCVEDEILQAIDDVEQLLAQRSHGAGRVFCVAPNRPGWSSNSKQGAAIAI